MNYYYDFWDRGVDRKFLDGECLKLSFGDNKSILAAERASSLGSLVCKAVKGVVSEPGELSLKLFIAKLLTE